MAATIPFLRNADGDAQFDYTRTSDERLARHLKSEFLNYFPSETAINARLQYPEDRIHVAYPAKSMGLFVPHGVLKVVDDVRNCVYVVDREIVTPAGVNVANVVHEFLGLEPHQLRETIQLSTRPLPWFPNAVPVAGALTYVGGLWVPVNGHMHAIELGLPRMLRWVIQTDACELWVRDLATNLTYEVSTAQLARGIKILDLLQFPEYIDKPGALIKSHTAARDWERGEDWTCARPPSITLDLELTAHRYWVWRNQFSSPRPPREPETHLDGLDDTILALIALGYLGRVVEPPAQEEPREDQQPAQSSASAASQQSFKSWDSEDTPPSLRRVESTSDESAALSEVELTPASMPELRSAWEEYLFSAHGARWLRNHARPRRGASPAQFYDYEVTGNRST